MESLISIQYLPNALFTFLIISIVVAKLITASRNKLALPPGPWKLPIIGNLHQLLSPLPHHRLRDLARKHGELMHLQLGELSYVIASSADAAREMLKTHDANFVQRPRMLIAVLADSASITFAPYGEYWRQLRKICSQELLTTANVRSLRPIREEEVSKLIEDLRSASGSTVNLSEKLFSLMYSITAKVLFGKKYKDQELFISATKESMEITGGLSVSDLFPSQNWLHWITGFKSKILRCIEKNDKIFYDIVKERRATRAKMATDVGKEKYLLDVLLDYQENGGLAVPLENKNIKDVMLEMFAAGSDTSATTTEWTILEILKSPRVMEKAQAEVRRVFQSEGNVYESRLHELTYLKSIIKESLRLHPPAPLLVPRESIEHCVMNGYDIPAKTKVLINAWSIGRDPRNWSEPEKFYPERFIESTIDFKGRNFELIPFGAGRRMCPGMTFAVANIELPLAQLLFHFDWKLPNGTSHKDLDMSERFGLTVRRKEELYVIPISRNNST